MKKKMQKKIRIDNLERISTCKEAFRLFKQNEKVFFYFNANDIDNNTYVYYLLSSEITFTRNIEILLKKFNVLGTYNFYALRNQALPDFPFQKQKSNIL